MTSFQRRAMNDAVAHTDVSNTDVSDLAPGGKTS